MVLKQFLKSQTFLAVGSGICKFCLSKYVDAISYLPSSPLPIPLLNVRFTIFEVPYAVIFAAVAILLYWLSLDVNWV